VPSAKALKPIFDLQNAVNAKDSANIPAKLAAAKSAASTNNDRYLIGELQLKAAADSNDLASASQAANDVAASGVLGAPDLGKLFGALGGSLYNAKQYDQAAAAYQRELQFDPQNTEPQLMIAEIRAAQGHPADAVSSLQQVIQTSKASGKPVDEAVYRRAVALAYDGKLPGTIELSRQWLAAYPSESSWQNSLAMYRNLRGGQAPEIVDVLRLARLTNSLPRATDYAFFANHLALDANYGEAKSVIDEGVAAGKIKRTDPEIAEILKASQGKVPTEAQLAAAEKSASIPTAYLRVGDRYYGAGNYAKAAELYREAKAKGADANLANLRLGEALARSGDKAGAAAALQSVSGPYADVAKFWLVYTQKQA
jgi:tetratricopeptide (TPR) repeat protein